MRVDHSGLWEAQSKAKDQHSCYIFEGGWFHVSNEHFVHSLTCSFHHSLFCHLRSNKKKPFNIYFIASSPKQDPYAHVGLLSPMHHTPQCSSPKLAAGAGGVMALPGSRGSLRPASRGPASLALQVGLGWSTSPTAATEKHLKSSGRTQWTTWRRMTGHGQKRRPRQGSFPFWHIPRHLGQVFTFSM